MWRNPVFTKEVRTKMRSRQPRAVQATVVALVLLPIGLCYYYALDYLLWPGAGSQAGRDGWQAVCALQTILVWVLAPAAAANAFTQEREQRTWDLLATTLLTPAEIVFGKLAARLLPLAALLAVFVPYGIACAAAGGVTLSRLVGSYALLGLWAVFMTVVGLYASWRSRRTATAIAIGYVVLGVLAIGTALVETTMHIGRAFVGSTETALLWINPARVGAAAIDTYDSNRFAVLAFSSVVYAGTAALLLWRMARTPRRQAAP
ncbi:MAG: ABC transporter permease subunit [Chthonomonadales bacterium]|nr:ABC transporter permease subunit [Chthonomonadales bacterium]